MFNRSLIGSKLKSFAVACVLALVGSFGLVGVASAQAVIDVTDGLAQLDAAGVAIAAIGGAMLVLAGIAAAYKWARAAFF